MIFRLVEKFHFFVGRSLYADQIAKYRQLKFTKQIKVIPQLDKCFKLDEKS